MSISCKMWGMSIPDQKKLKKIWAEVPADYYFNLNFGQRLWHEWKWLVIKHLLLKQLKTSTKILEIGCAGGHLTSLLGDLYPKARITGIDVYGHSIELAKSRFPKLQFKVADAHDLPFARNTFDLVVLSETIEHVVKPSLVLHEISRVLKRDGQLLIEMDSGSRLFRFVWYMWTRFGRGRVWRQAHLHPFTAKELESLIVSNGFRIQDKLFSHFGMAVSFLVSPKW